MKDKVITMKISRELSQVLSILPYKLGTGGLKQTITHLASLFVNDKLDYGSPATRKEICLKSKADRERDTEQIAISMKGNPPSRAIFIKAKRKLEILCGREFKDTEVIRALLILAKENLI